MNPAQIRAALARTARRLRQLRRLERQLERLQARRRRLLARIPRPSVMYDSIEVGLIPVDAPAVAGYVGGHWPTFPQLVKRYPRARRLSIAVNASEDADCLDIENGDATPEEAPGWVRRQLARGAHRPRLYSSVSQMQQVVIQLARHGISRNQVLLFTAHYTGQPHICQPGCYAGFHEHADATQYTNHALGRNLDESLCTAEFWS